MKPTYSRCQGFVFVYAKSTDEGKRRYEEESNWLRDNMLANNMRDVDFSSSRHYRCIMIFDSTLAVHFKLRFPPV